MLWPFIAGSLIILGIVYAIPKLVILSTESENNPNHIYTIFMDEAGYKANKSLSALGCLFPFILISESINELEGIALVSVIFIISFIYHSSVYKGYPVLNLRMKLALVILLCAVTVASILTRYGYLPSDFFTFVIFSSGVGWGGYAVYRRSELIRITRV